MTKQVSPHQLEMLLDFLGHHRILALGRVRGKEGNVLSNKLWLQCSKILNSDVEGVQKTPKRWKKYYNQYKSRVRAKARTIKQGLKGNSEGLAELSALTPLEERLCSIVGDSTSPFNATDDPLDSLAYNHSGDGHDDESLGQDTEFSGNMKADSEQSEECNLTSQVYIDNAMDYTNTTEELGKKSQPSNSYRSPYSLPPEQYPPRSPPPKAVKRGFEDFEQRFASMEQSRIKIDRELACAINRQATAIEGFVGQMKRFVDIYERNSQQNQASKSPPKQVSEDIYEKNSQDNQTSKSPLNEVSEVVHTIKEELS